MMTKQEQLIRNFLQKIREQKKFVIYVVLLGFAILGLVVSSLSFILKFYVVVIGIFFFFLIFYWLVRSTYDFERKKIKTANPLQALILMTLLLLMSIPGGYGSVLCLLSFVLFGTLQIFLWIRFFVKKIWLQKK